MTCSSFDYDECHVTKFPLINEAACSWSYNNIHYHCIMMMACNAKECVMDMSSGRPMGASVARLVILVSGACSRSWN